MSKTDVAERDAEEMMNPESQIGKLLLGARANIE